MSHRKITWILCVAEVLGLAGFASFAALLPSFMDQWGLTNTRAGWLSAVYYGAYVVAVPVLTALTDRNDARRIMVFGLVIGAAAAFGFAWGAGGFWSALVFRFMAGVSLAGIYMPGLKLLSDHTEGPRQSRYISFYTACFSLGASVSYLLTGEINEIAGWQAAFTAAGFLTLAAALLVQLWAPRGKVLATVRSRKRLVDFRPVFRNRAAMAYILGYAAHMWELFSMRSWIVAFLVYCSHLQPVSALVWRPTQVAALINLIGLPASIGGNELSRRFGRRKTVMRIMVASALFSVVIGFSAPLPYMFVVILCLIYGMLVLGDSASLTAGAIAAAPEDSRGATLAVHSTMGFGSAFLGPVAVGLVLDLLQATPGLAWGAAFMCMGAGCAVGPLVVRRFSNLQRTDNMADRDAGHKQPY